MLARRQALSNRAMAQRPEMVAEKALVLAPIGRDGAVVANILGSAGFACTVCNDVASLVSGLDRAAAAAVVAEEAFASAADVQAVRSWLTAQPPWSDFPFVLLALATDDADERRAALRDMLGNITLLERPLRPDTLVRAVGAAARARQRQLEAARLLEERTRSEAERRAGEERLRELFENAADAIFIAGADRRLTDVNPSVCSLLGSNREELVGLPVTALVAPGDIPEFNRWLDLQSDGKPAAAEWGLHREDGARVDVEICARVLNDGRWQAFARDIGARKRAETALRHLNETLEVRVAERSAELIEAQTALAQAQKMEAVGQLTGGVAHDFNNLLMVISGGLEMLSRLHDPERRQRVMEGMRHAVERGTALTKQLLTFSRRQALKPEPIALDQRISAMRELLERSLRGDIQVVAQFAPDLWPVNVDPTQLELAVLNLAVNARDAMPGSGILTIRADNAPGLDDGELIGDFVLLSVSDTGTGIPPEILARLFEPFFTTKDVGKGSGLGLAQIYGFAKQSGGVVRIDSEVGRGTKVMLFLPRSDRAMLTSNPPTSVGSTQLRDVDPRKPAATVLLVEDDETVAALAAESLDQLGYKVARVPDAVAALAELANGRCIDLVFSDIMMPGGMSGADLAREIIRRRPNLPVVLTTGYDGQSVLTAAELKLPLLRKPYRLEALFRHPGHRPCGGQT